MLTKFSMKSQGFGAGEENQRGFQWLFLRKQVNSNGLGLIKLKLDHGILHMTHCIPLFVFRSWNKIACWHLFHSVFIRLNLLYGSDVVAWLKLCWVQMTTYSNLPSFHLYLILSFYLFIYLFVIFLAVPSGMQNLSSLTRDWTHACCIGTDS